MHGNFNYIGSRKPLKEMFENSKIIENDSEIQIIDLGGSDVPELDYFLDNANLHKPTIILSNRRFELNDWLGSLESSIMQNFKYILLYRTSPLDLGADLYKGWAKATGILLTSFSPQGVAWINTYDLIEACGVDIHDIYERSGKAYDLTGPRLISMEEMKNNFESEFETKIELQCKNKQEVKQILSSNNIPEYILEWLTSYQEQTSDERLKPVTTTLNQILSRESKEPLF